MRGSVVRLFIIAAVTAVVAMFGDASASAQVSTLDAHRARAAAMFDSRLDTLGVMRAGLTDDLKKYERACRGKVTTGRGIGVVFLPAEPVWTAQWLEIDNETTPPCRMLVTEIKTRSQQLARESEQIDEDARRRGVYPGVMRDLKRGYGFE